MARTPTRLTTVLALVGLTLGLPACGTLREPSETAAVDESVPVDVPELAGWPARSWLGAVLESWYGDAALDVVVIVDEGRSLLPDDLVDGLTVVHDASAPAVASAAQRVLHLDAVTREDAFHVLVEFSIQPRSSGGCWAGGTFHVSWDPLLNRWFAELREEWIS